MIDTALIAQAAALLRRGGLVAFPTETVYGLGADAENPQAVARVYAAKGRPAGHPLIVHLASVAQMSKWALEVTPLANALARAFWPGPLTLILRRSALVRDCVTGGQDSVGLRVPAHPMAQALLAAFGGGIAAPSANRFGRVSATTAQHVRNEFGAGVDLVLDGGACDVGIESTIVDVRDRRVVLLRPGHISAQEIERVTGIGMAARNADSPRAPGTLAAHYAPETPLTIVAHHELAALATRMTDQGKCVAVLAAHAAQPQSLALFWRRAPVGAHAYAHDLYANLRALDEAGCDHILVERPGTTSEWDAVNDRLGRAQSGSAPP